MLLALSLPLTLSQNRASTTIQPSGFAQRKNIRCSRPRLIRIQSTRGPGWHQQSARRPESVTGPEAGFFTPSSPLKNPPSALTEVRGQPEMRTGQQEEPLKPPSASVLLRREGHRCGERLDAIHRTASPCFSFNLYLAQALSRITPLLGPSISAQQSLLVWSVTAAPVAHRHDVALSYSELRAFLLLHYAKHSSHMTIYGVCL